MNQAQLIAATIARLSAADQVAAADAAKYDAAVEVVSTQVKALTALGNAAAEDSGEQIGYFAAASALNDKARELAETAMALHAQVRDAIRAL